MGDYTYRLSDSELARYRAMAAVALAHERELTARPPGPRVLVMQRRIRVTSDHMERASVSA